MGTKEKEGQRQLRPQHTCRRREPSHHHAGMPPRCLWLELQQKTPGWDTSGGHRGRGTGGTSPDCLRARRLGRFPSSSSGRLFLDFSGVYISSSGGSAQTGTTFSGG